MLFASTAVIAALYIVGAVAMVAGAGVSIYSGYQAQSAANEAARMQESASQAAANAQQMAAQAQADQLKDQADMARLQASVEDKKAGVAQQQGEIEAQRRMIQLSYDIGNLYSQYAGNNLLVDGGNDSFGQLLTANVREGAQDIGIIKSNTENAVWEHSMNKTMALLSANSYDSQSEAALLIGDANSNATILSGQAQAFATRQQGLTALYQGWGSGISSLGSAAFMSAGGLKGLGTTNNNITSWGSGGVANANNSGGWSSTNTVTNISTGWNSPVVG